LQLSLRPHPAAQRRAEADQRGLAEAALERC